MRQIESGSSLSWIRPRRERDVIVQSDEANTHDWKQCQGRVVHPVLFSNLVVAGPLPACLAGEPVWEANHDSASVLFDPCRLVRQVKQFGELEASLSFPNCFTCQTS